MKCSILLLIMFLNTALFAQMTYKISIPIDSVQFSTKVLDLSFDTKSATDSVINIESPDYYNFKGKLIPKTGQLKFTYTDYEYKLITEGYFVSTADTTKDTILVEQINHKLKPVTYQSLRLLINGPLSFKYLETNRVFRKRYFEKGIETKKAPIKVIEIKKE
jgi:hypothetical protein